DGIRDRTVTGVQTCALPISGSCPALVTPFDQNGAINYDAFGKLIDAQIEAGVDAVCVCGTTGESATMSIREHIAAVEFCVKRVKDRKRVGEWKGVGMTVRRE